MNYKKLQVPKWLGLLCEQFEDDCPAQKFILTFLCDEDIKASKTICPKCGGRVSLGSKSGLCQGCYHELNSLAPEDNEFLKLLENNNYSYKNIGDLLGVSGSTVSRWAHKKGISNNDNIGVRSKTEKLEFKKRIDP